MRTMFLRNVFFPEIEKQSKGRIKIEPHWHGELAISYDALKKLRDCKTIDITTVVSEYDAAALHRLHILKSFLIGPTGNNQVKFFSKIFKKVPVFNAELKENNVVPLFFLQVSAWDFSAACR